MDKFKTSMDEFLPPGTELKNSTGQTITLDTPFSRGGFSLVYHATLKVGTGRYNYHKLHVIVKEYFPYEHCRRLRDGVTVELFDIENVRTFREKFKKETDRIAENAKLRQHPNIVKVLDNFSANGTDYCVLEYLEKGSLQDMIEKNGKPLSVRDAVRYITAICDALTVCHKEHILHNDINPSNIAVSSEDIPKLIDFGICKSFDRHGKEYTHTDQARTSKYCSPEQEIRSTDFIPQSDIYALAGTLHYLVTGKCYKENKKIALSKEHALYPILEYGLKERWDERCPSAEAFKMLLLKATGQKKNNVKAILATAMAVTVLVTGGILYAGHESETEQTQTEITRGDQSTPERPQGQSKTDIKKVETKEKSTSVKPKSYTEDPQPDIKAKETYEKDWDKEILSRRNEKESVIGDSRTPAMLTDVLSKYQNGELSFEDIRNDFTESAEVIVSEKGMERTIELKNLPWFKKNIPIGPYDFSVRSIVTKGPFLHKIYVNKER